MPIAAAPLTTHVGIEITVDSGLPFADESNADECLGALEGYGVVVYRAANISDEDLVSFSRLLGEVVVSPTREHQYPEIATITLDPGKTNAVLAWYRQGNFQWHIDGATEQLPQKATLLLAREVDESGGDTEFASTYAAYEALSETTKSEIADLAVIHSFATAQLSRSPRCFRGRAGQVGRDSNQGPPFGLDTWQWTKITAHWRDSRRSRRLAHHQEHGTPQPASRVVHATRICTSAQMEPRRPRCLGQHWDASPSLYLRADVTSPYAPHHLGRCRVSRHVLRSLQ